MPNEKMEKIVANFSNLSDQECAFIIQNNLLEALESDTYFEWELVTKFFSIGYEIREPLCKFFDSALKRNDQKIAGIAVKDWLHKYLVRSPVATKRLNAFLDFVVSNPEIKMLGEKDRIRLMRIFRIYDYILISPVFDMEDNATTSIFRFPMRFSQSLEEIIREMASADFETTASSGTASEKLAVKEALHKFPKLGEQAVTASPIKLKQFDQPVRPSVRNWLYDYTSQLGQTGHSSMDRTTYLFRSDNAKNLSSPEREKLAIILKSFDENMPLPIDGERQEIVFESFARKEAPPQRSFPAPPKPSASLNFIHHVERSSAPSAPVQRNVASVPKQQSPPEAFIKPYLKPEIPKVREVDQSSTFPLSRLNRDNSSRSNLTGVPQGRTFEDAPPKIDEDKIEYTNPYPKPGTHETQFEKTDENISNVRFSEGAPKDSFTPISQVSARRMPPAGPSSPPVIPVRPLAPVQKSVPSPSSPAKTAAYHFTPPDKNMIYPRGDEPRRDRPEPKIDGNIVDLKGDK